jgi:hypothetical protein
MNQDTHKLAKLEQSIEQDFPFIFNSVYGDVEVNKDSNSFRAEHYGDEDILRVWGETPAIAIVKCTDWIKKQRQYQKDGIPYE